MANKKTQTNAAAALAKMPPELTKAMHKMTPVQAMLFIGEWLNAHGVVSPNLMVTDDGIPKGAEAVTRVRPDAPTEGSIRIRPSVLSDGKDEFVLPTGISNLQNLLAHEGAHFVDITKRGTSDHSTKFRKLLEQLGVVANKRDK